MANMIVEDGKYVLSQAISAAGDIALNLATQNKFVDKNIEIDISTPAGVLAGGATTLSVSDTESILTESSTQPSSGEYITVTGSGAASVTTGGFIAEDTAVSSTTATKYYTMQHATFNVSGPSVVSANKGYVGAGITVGTVASGAQTITGGGLTSGAKSSTVTSSGYYNGTSYDTSDKVTLATTEASGYYKIVGSGSATVNRAAVTKQVTTAGYFTADAEAQSAIAADSITVATPDQAYYIKKSTMTATSVTPSTTQQTVTISDGYYPSARTVTVAALTEVTPTTSLSDSGLSTYFNDGTASDKDVTLTPQYSNTAGYVSAHTNANNGGIVYKKIKTTSITQGATTVSSGTATRGTATWGSGWITSGAMSAATFGSAAASGKTSSSYVDISDTTEAPVLVSGDFLYINKGYVDDLKISLKKLVPDGSDVKGHAEYILSGHSAYDNDGTLVSGSIQTYLGEYTVA